MFMWKWPLLLCSSSPACSVPHLVTSPAVPQSALHHGHIPLSPHTTLHHRHCPELTFPSHTAQSPLSPATLPRAHLPQPHCPEHTLPTLPRAHLPHTAQGGKVNWDTDTQRKGARSLFFPRQTMSTACCWITWLVGGFVSKLGDAELGEISGTSPISVGHPQRVSEEPLLLRNGKQVMVTCVWKT